MPRLATTLSQTPPRPYFRPLLLKASFERDGGRSFDGNLVLESRFARAQLSLVRRLSRRTKQIQPTKSRFRRFRQPEIGVESQQTVAGDVVF